MMNTISKKMLARLGALVIGVHAVLPGAVAFATDEQEKTVETVTVAETVTAVETVTEPAPEAPAQAAELTDTLAQATEETQTPVLSAPEQSVEETVSVQTPEEDTAVQTNAPVTTDGATTELTPATEELTPESIQAPQPAEVSNAEAIPTQAQDTVQAPLADESQTTIITKEEKKADRPSMIADRSDEGQPLTQGTTFRGGKKDPVKFYNSKDEIFPANAKYGIVLTSDESKVDIEETKKLYQSFGDFVESEVSKLGKYEILEIDGKKFLFEGKNKGVYVGQHNSNFKKKFVNGGSSKQCDNLENIDIDNAISPTFINTTKKPYRNCHTIKDSSGTTTIGYTIKNGDYYWFYAPVKKPQPTLKTATFYTSTGKSFAVVLKDDGTLDIEKNKELAQTHYADNQEVLDTIKKVKQAEIVDFDRESMLFALLDDNSMKGFAGAENSKFQLAFKADGASSMDGTIVPNLTTVKKAFWVDEKLPIQKYREIKNGDTVIGYTFQNEAHHWFYAPATVKETKAFYTSTNTEFKVVLKEDKTVDVEATKIYLAPLKEKLPDDLKALADSATDTDVVIEEINGVHILFVDLKTSTKAFADQQDSAFKNAFKGGTPGEPFYDAATIIKAHWVDRSKEITDYNEIKNGSEVIGYTLKNKDNDWFYAQKRNVTQTPFYTSNDKAFPVILRADGQSVNFEDTKKLLVPMIPLLSDDLKAEAQDFADNATADKVEIKTIEGVKMLFVRTAPHTKVFFASPKSIFQNAFKGGNADLSKIKYDLTKAEAANWVDTTKTITAYNPITKDGEVIGYALKNKDNDWFYAPLRLDIVNFYGSNNGKLKVVMQDEKTVDLAQTKKLLVPQIPLLPANLQAEAQDFADNATDADVKIEEIEGVKLLFVKTSKHTKVFRTPDTDTMFQNAFKEGKVMNIGVVYTDAIVKPDWVDTSKKVTHYNEIKKADKVIGYALKTEDHHWFYAPKKEFTITPFYTSNNKIVPVVMKDPMTIDLPATKSVLYPLIKDITNPKDKAFAETFIKTATEKDVEIKEIKDVKVLFVNLGTSTKAFAGEASSPFQNAFKEGTAINANIVYHSPIKPTWATSSDVKKYNEIKKADKLIGYTLKDADNHWFYASAAHRVNFDTDGATAIADQSIPLDGKATKPTDPSKAGYRFDGWFVDKTFKTAFDFTKVITEHTTVYAKWTRRSSGGGSSAGSSSGGSSSGGSSSGGSSSGGSSSSASSASSPTVSAVSTPGVEEVVLPGEVTTPVCSVEGSTFSSEQNDAYLWACAQDITTIRSITQARLEDGLTRAELAKMMAVYVTKILGKTLVVTGSADYADVDASLGDLAEYIQLAYQLQIMGIHADGSALMNFNPHQTVTRAEFATVFSRVLFGNSYNQSGEQWYVQHLHALQKVGILQNTTATMQELRGWVLLMLQRAAQLK